MRLSFHALARQYPLPDKPARIPRSVIHLNRLPNLTGQPQRVLPEPSPTGGSYYRSPSQSQLTAGQAKVIHATRQRSGILTKARLCNLSKQAPYIVHVHGMASSDLQCIEAGVRDDRLWRI